MGGRARRRGAGWGIRGRPWGEGGSCSSKMGVRGTGHRRPSRPTQPLVHHPRPYGWPGILPDFPAWVDAYEGRSIGGGRGKTAPTAGWVILFILVVNKINFYIDKNNICIYFFYFSWVIFLYKWVEGNLI